MKFSSGTKVKLNSKEFQAEDVILVLERLESAVPHLHFKPWSARSYNPAKAHDPDELPIGEALWKGNLRTEVEVILNLRTLRLGSICRRDAGALSEDDYQFLIGLADEAARLVDASLTGAMSLFEYGTSAVAEDIKRRLSLDFDPVGAIRFIRSLSQDTYENQRISYGLILSKKHNGQDYFAKGFDNKRLKRLTDGFSTALTLDSKGRLSDYVCLTPPVREGLQTTRRPWWVAGLAEKSHRLAGVGIALLRNGEIIVVHRRRMLFTLRAGQWRLWNHAAILARLVGAWNKRGPRRQLEKVLIYLYHVAIDLSFRRSGGLLVVVPDDRSASQVLTSKTDKVHGNSRGVAEQALDRRLASTKIHNMDRRLIADLASLDGALIVNGNGRVLAYGAMTKSAAGLRQGARTRAAIASSSKGIAIKVSSDGTISLYAARKCFMEL
jgi:hypothetical protein